MKSNLTVSAPDIKTPAFVQEEIPQPGTRFQRRTTLVRPVPHTPEIIQFEAVGNMRGQIFIRWNRVRFARYYQVYISSNINDQKSWTEFASVTSSRITMAGLESNKRYWVKVTAVNPAGASADSAQVSVITQ